MFDVKILDELVFELLVIYLMDKGYLDFQRLYRLHQAQAFFVTRAKDNLAFARSEAGKVDKESGLRCDQTITLTNYKEQVITCIFLTNNFELSALEIALLYKYRWQCRWRYFSNGLSSI